LYDLRRVPNPQRLPRKGNAGSNENKGAASTSKNTQNLKVRQKPQPSRLVLKERIIYIQKKKGADRRGGSTVAGLPSKDRIARQLASGRTTPGAKRALGKK